jgi:hypothetical protein
MQKFTFRSPLLPNQVSFSHGQETTETSAICTVLNCITPGVAMSFSAGAARRDHVSDRMMNGLIAGMVEKFGHRKPFPTLMRQLMLRTKAALVFLRSKM